MSRLLAIAVVFAAAGSVRADSGPSFFPELTARSGEATWLEGSPGYFLKAESSEQTKETAPRYEKPRQSSYANVGYLYFANGQLAFTILNGNTTFVYGGYSYNAPIRPVAAGLYNGTGLYSGIAPYTGIAAPYAGPTMYGYPGFVYGW
jgi:hypothetical protein